MILMYNIEDIILEMETELRSKFIVKRIIPIVEINKIDKILELRKRDEECGGR